MRRMVPLAAVFGLMLLLGIAALRERPLPKADFVYALSDSVRTLDPAKMSWTNEIRMALGIWEGLAAYDPCTIRPISGAATLPADVTDGGLVYTFQLRQDARWSNGDPVTADDFIYAWRRAIEPGTAEDYAFLITDNIDGAADYSRWRNRAVRILRLLRDLARNHEVADDDRHFIATLNLPGTQGNSPDWATAEAAFRLDHLAQMDNRFARVGLIALSPQRLRVRLARPISYFPDLVAFSTFLPIHHSIELLRCHNDPDVTDLTLWVYDPQWVKPDYHANGYPGLITNGSFRLAEWQFKRYMLFKKNEHYWDRANVRSQSIMARIITESNTAFMAYEQGELHWLNDVTRLDFAPTLVQQARSGRRSDIHITPAFGTYFYNFNCLPALPDGSTNPFADPRIRLAFNLAVDKQAIVEQVKKLGNPAARNFVPPDSIPGYDCPSGPACNPEEARDLLSQAGYPAGKGMPTIEILYNTGHGHEFPAQAIAEMWRAELGVEVALRGKEVKSFADDKQNHRFMICRASWFGDYGDPTTFLDMLITNNGNNDSGFSHDAYDALMAQAAATTDPAKRMQLLAQAETIIITQQMPILPLYYYINLLAYHPDVHGIHPNPRNMYSFKHMYVASPGLNRVSQSTTSHE